jgi:hypothetical protein
MGIFERYVGGAQHKWNWYMCTLAGSMIPMALRFFISLDYEINMFDIKDVLFAGLAMNLSNLNLMRNEFEERERIAVLSAIFIIFISVALGASFIDESSSIKKPFVWSKIISVGIVLGSVWASYKANEFVYSNNIKN